MLKNLALFFVVDCVTLPLHTSYRVQYGLPFSFKLVDLSNILQMSSFDSQLLTNLHAIEKFSTLIISQRFKAWYMTRNWAIVNKLTKFDELETERYRMLSTPCCPHDRLPHSVSHPKTSSDTFADFRLYKSMGDRCEVQMLHDSDHQHQLTKWRGSLDQRCLREIINL